MVCKDCPLRAICKAPCSDVERLLPKDWTAEMSRQRSTRRQAFFRRLLRERRDVRLMLEYRHLLSGRQREIFDLKYNEGLTQLEIAELLGLYPRVVGTYLDRAYRVIAKAMRGYH